MPRIALAPYSLRIRDASKGGMPSLLLGSLPPEKGESPKRDFLDVLEAILKSFEGGYQAMSSAPDASIIAIRDLERVGRQLSGIVAVGDHGYESDIVNVDDGAHRYRRLTNEAEMLPFYFRFEAPERANECFVVLERFGQRGVRDKFLTPIEGIVEDRLKPLRSRVDVGHVVPKNLWRRYLKDGELRKLRFITVEVPSDLADFEGKGNDERIGYVELSINARRNGDIGWLNDRIQQYAEGGKGGLVEPLPFEPTQTKAEFVMPDGTQRTIVLEHPDQHAAAVDVTHDVGVGTDGHPRREHLDREAKGLIKTLRDAVTPPPK